MSEMFPYLIIIFMSLIGAYSQSGMRAVIGLSLIWLISDIASRLLFDTFNQLKHE